MLAFDAVSPAGRYDCFAYDNCSFGNALPDTKHDFSILKYENSCFVRHGHGKKYSPVILLAHIIPFCKSATHHKRKQFDWRCGLFSGAMKVSRERAGDLARQCTELVRNGNDFPTVWGTLLKGHVLVEGIPREKIERQRSLLHIPLVTGEQLVFDADVKEFRVH